MAYSRTGRKIIVAGHICLDITPVFSSGKCRPLSQVLTPGKLIQMKEASISTGGAVANTGLALKILGAEAQLMGKAGRDEFGKILLEKLNRYGAGAADGMILSADSSTSYSIVIAPPGTDRIFLHHPGANDTFRGADLDYEKIAGADYFHFGYPPLMRHMYENDGRELTEIFRTVKKYGLITSLDMAAVDPDADAGKADWGKILRNVLPYVDYFVPSVEELCFMADRSRYEEWLRRAGGNEVPSVLDVNKDILPLARKVLDMGASHLLLKCGAPGLFYMDDTIQIFERSYRPEKVLSGTGAGDTSIAAFLKARMDGCPIEQCIRLAAAAGASCVEAYDALSGLKPLEELEKKIEEGWEKL